MKSPKKTKKTKRDLAKEVFKVGSHSVGYVWSSFLEEFGNDEVVPGVVLPSQKLPRSMTDSEVLKDLGVQECTLGDIIATLDTAGPEMKDGWANIFYVKGHPSRVVSVDWCAGGGEWYVFVWFRGGLSWLGGHRVFSPATGAGKISTMGSGVLTLETLAKRIKELEDWKERVQK